MECRECRERMQLYLAEALPGRWAAAFEEHIAECGECARELASSREIIELLQEMPAPVPPADLASRIKAAASAAIIRPEPAARRPIAAYLKFAGASAAALLLAVGTLTLLGPPGSKHDTRGPSVTPVAAVGHAKSVVSEPAALRSVVTAVPLPAQPALPRATRAKPVRHHRAVTVAGTRPGPSPARVAPIHEVASTSPRRAVTPAASLPPSSDAGPTVVSALDRAPNVRVLRTVREEGACVPVTLVCAALRTGPAHASTPARVVPTDDAAEDFAAHTLIGTVVANAVVNRYVREALIESDAMLMSLATSAPPPTINHLVREDEAEETTNGW